MESEMSNRNELLAAIYVAMGGADSTIGLTRNELLEKISVLDGAFIYIRTNEWLLRGWYSALTATPPTQRTRNEHLRLIAEVKSSASIPVGLSRNDYYAIILANSAPQLDDWILPAAIWNDAGVWDDTATWDDGV